MTQPEVVEVRRVMTRDEAKTYLNKKPAPGIKPLDLPRDTPVLVQDADTKQHIGVVFPFPGDLEEYRQAVLAIKMSTVIRGGGIRNEATIFGMLARSGMLRRAACCASDVALRQPREHAVLTGVAPALWAKVKELSDQAAAMGELPMQEVLADWRMGDSPWTSGVLNRTSALPYHFDKNNFPETWACMPTVRRMVDGGFLHLMEYDFALPCRDGDVAAFRNSHLLHGVTRFRIDHASGYRYSAVYYSVKGMANCLPHEEEILDAQRRRTGKEADLIERQTALGLIK